MNSDRHLELYFAISGIGAVCNTNPRLGIDDIAYIYLKSETAVGEDGWFPTGDVGVIDPEGYVALTDRTKDLIKSGGAWISSIAIENIAIVHREVAEAAAIAVPDAKGGERPLLIIVARPGCTPDPEALRAFYDGKVPKSPIPDRVVLADDAGLITSVRRGTWGYFSPHFDARVRLDAALASVLPVKVTAC